MTFRFLLLLAALTCLSPVPAGAQSRFSDIYSVTGVQVDVKAPDVFQAREAAIREAGRRGWIKMWAKLVDARFAARRPNLSDGDLRELVAAVDIANERSSATRYIATMTVTYDPLEVRRLMERAGAIFSSVRSRPMLLLPLMRDAGANYVFEPTNAWAQAWSRFPNERSLIDYVRLVGSTADRLWLNSFQSLYRNPGRIQGALVRYRAEDIALMRATLSRTYPGGPVTGLFEVYRGAALRPLATLRLTAAREADLPTMLDEAVQQLDQAFTNAIRGELSSRPQVATGPVAVTRAFGGYEVVFDTPDAAAWETIAARLRQAPEVSSVQLSSLSIGGVSKARIASTESMEFVLYALDQVGFRTEQTPEGLKLRDKTPEDASLPRPLTNAERKAQESASTAPAAPAAPKLEAKQP
jgi:hypothetical protein